MNDKTLKQRLARELNEPEENISYEVIEEFNNN